MSDQSSVPDLVQLKVFFGDEIWDKSGALFGTDWDKVLSQSRQA